MAKKWTFHTRINVALALLAGSLITPDIRAATLAVIYPEAPPPYEQVFEQIIEGIDEQHKDKLLRYPIAPDDPLSPEQLLSRLRRDQVDMVVTLGRRSFSMVQELTGQYPFVSGALPLTPDNKVSGVSLITDPGNLFQQLSSLAPNIKRVFVVYTEKNQWLIDLASAAARKRQLKLESIKVDSLPDALRQYQQILGKAQSSSDAIWLPIDSVTSNEHVVLPCCCVKPGSGVWCCSPAARRT
jgi:putative ABC transport system substrate-binding protein